MVLFQEVDATRNEVKVLAQLKLDDAVNNDFEYCEVHVPFPNRYPISTTHETTRNTTRTTHVLLCFSY